MWLEILQAWGNMSRVDSCSSVSVATAQGSSAAQQLCTGLPVLILHCLTLAIAGQKDGCLA